MTAEIPVSFLCDKDYLYGVLHSSNVEAARGVVIVVGGPQYRVGSHRQFVLLARRLARAGIPALRFDYRGMGDSDGNARTFGEIDTDIRRAIEIFIAQVPTLKEIVIWGLCDAASAALFYAPLDTRVTGLVLLNPWVRTEEGKAGAYLKHYYLARLIDPDLWRKIARGEFHAGAAVRSFLAQWATWLGFERAALKSGDKTSGVRAPLPLRARMLDSLHRYRGRVLLILSGDDLTAGEFKDMVAASRPWRRLLRHPRVTRCDLSDANHTFSRRAWRARVEDWTEEWIKSW